MATIGTNARWGVSPVKADNLPFKAVTANEGSIITKEELRTLTHFLCTTNPTDISRWFESPAENILSLRRYPFDIIATLGDGKVMRRTVPLQIGNVQVVEKYGFLNRAVYGADLGQFERYYFTAGEFDINPFFTSFLDLSPYTSYLLYLPFYGFCPIDPIDVYRQHINITYVVDFNTGNADIVVQRQPIKAGVYNYDQYDIIKSVTCKIAIDIPVTSSNASEIMRNMINVGVNATAAIASGNIAGIINSGISAISAGQRHYSSGVLGSGTSSMFLPQTVLLFTQRPRPNYPDNYDRTYGRPCARGGNLSDFNGFVKISDYHTDGVQAYGDELAEIQRRLTEGIIL